MLESWPERRVVRLDDDATVANDKKTVHRIVRPEVDDIGQSVRRHALLFGR